MAAKSIETKLSLVGEDKTGSTFAEVARKLRTIEQAAAGVAKRMDAVSAGMSNFAQKARHEDIARRMGYGVAATVAAASPRVASASARMGGSIASNAAEFASYAAPGVAGAALGMSGAAIGGLAVGGAATYAIKQAVDFDKEMANVKKKVNLAPGQTMDDVEKMINRTARAVGKSRAEVARLTADAGATGIGGDDLERFVMLAAKAASAWDVTGSEASKSLANIRAQTGMTITELEKLADKINDMGDNTASSERDVLGMLKRSAAAAKASGASLDETMAITTALNSAGMQEEVAARFTSQFLGGLRTANSGTKKQKKAWHDLGLSPQAIEAGMQKDASGTAAKVLEAVSKSKNPAATGITLFGKEWWDEAARAQQVLPEIVKNLQMLKSGKWKGSLDNNLAIDLATTSNHLERFGALTSEVGDRLSRWALPSINAQLERTLKAFDTAEKTGFLAGPDGKPIERIADKTPVAFGTANRRLFLNEGAMRLDADKNRTGALMPLSGAYDRVPVAAGEPGAPDWKAGSSAYAKTAAPGVMSGSRTGLGFGLAGPVNYGPALQAVAKLEGSARIENVVKVEPSEWFRVMVDQVVRAYGNLRSDTGVSMQP